MSGSLSVEEALSHPGYVVDVPVTLSVAVRGPGLTEEAAMIAARRFAEGLAPTRDYMLGFASGGDVPVITEASLETPSDESCEILDELEAET